MNKNLAHLRLADLQLFISAAKFKNLGKAAQHNYISQSAASAAIQRVENAFEQELCTHEKRQFTLLPDGISLVHRAEKWLAQFSNEVVKSEPISIRLVTTHAISKVIIPKIISYESIDLKLMRPDFAYNALIKNEADIVIVPGNALWMDVISTEITKGFFQLYASKKINTPEPILLPEDQIEVLDLKQRWQDKYNSSIPIKTCVPSWSLIVDICCNSNYVGFLPDFLAVNTCLRPVDWQPLPPEYKILALYNKYNLNIHNRIKKIIAYCRDSFLV